MSVLFLSHEQPSHAYDTFFDGCLQIFNEIFVFPPVDKYKLAHMTLNYLLPTTAAKRDQMWLWWGCNKSEKITFVSDLTQLPKDPSYIVFTNRDLDTFKSVISQFNNSYVIFIEEEEDRDFVLHKKYHQQLDECYSRIDLHLKVDYIEGKVLPNVKPFYMSAPLQKILDVLGEPIKDLSDRDIDICYLCYGSHKNRIEFFNILSGYSRGNNLILLDEHRYGLRDYFRLINRSKIFISVSGSGWSNTRNVEGPICGAALFTEEVPILIPNDYLHKDNAVFFNKENLILLLDEYLSDVEKLERLRQHSIEHCNNYHTSVARAKWVLDLCK